MPSTAIFLTIEEYTAIIDRLTALEAALKQRDTDVASLLLRMQSLESTMSAYAPTLASIPSLAKRITILETPVVTKTGTIP